jgi:hypothetical protein
MGHYDECCSCRDSEEARLYREYLAHLPEYDLPEYDKSDDCNYVFTEEDERQLEAETALQKLLDEEEEIERAYNEKGIWDQSDDWSKFKVMRNDISNEPKKPKRFVIHATRVTETWHNERDESRKDVRSVRSESVTQIPLFYIDGNVHGCRTQEEAEKIAKIILPNYQDSNTSITHYIAAFEL